MRARAVASSFCRSALAQAGVMRLTRLGDFGEQLLDQSIAA
jgi:hypothetical protein